MYTKAELLNLYNMDLDSLLNESKKYLKDEVEFCSIINARNGKCSQNCKYCAQSSHYNTEIESYPLMEVNEVLEAARDSQKNGADRVAIVTSGKTPDESDFDTMLDMIKALNKEGIKSCASIGILNKNQAKKLAETGLVRFHHNINTCRSYHPEICTTHTYEDRINTAKLVKKYGMEKQVEYISFSMNICEQLVSLAPDAEVAYLNGDCAPKDIKAKGLTGIDYSYKVFYKHPEWVKEAQSLGLKVNVWTVNKTADLQKMIAMGVDLLTTDQVLEAKEMVSGREAR